MTDSIEQFSVDKLSAQEGEYVNVSWICRDTEAVSLSVNDGIMEYSLPLADSGQRTILIKKSAKGKTILTLRSVYNGKVEKKELTIKVKNQKTVKAPKVGSLKDKFQTFLYDFKSYWKTFAQRLKYGWNNLSPKKRTIYTIILAAIVLIYLDILLHSFAYGNHQRKVHDQEIPQQEENVWT